jgi:serine/threonine protein kinase/tetratricopeptide (TPR) repeat protein
LFDGLCALRSVYPLGLVFEAGTLLEGRFRIAALVGEGGMGAVYRATDTATGETVALKVLKATVASRAKERFLREARVLAALDHPGIVRFKHLGALDEGETFLVMEWLEGQDLATRLTRQGVTYLEGVRITRGVAEALASAHAQGLVHRDVKPANIFLLGGRPESVKILDFGIAHGGATSVTLTDPGMAMGTPAYMAPEQARGGTAVDLRADLFSLGCVLYECLAGATPFSGDSPIACLAQILVSEPKRLGLVVPGIPRALDDLVMSMLEKEPSSRPDTAGAVARELGAIEPLLHEEGTAGTVSVRQVSLDEKRVASILVARDPSLGPTRANEETLSFDQVERAVAPARAPVEANGGTLTILSDGTALAVFSGPVTASDLARRAARAALGVRSTIPTWAFAVSTDIAAVSGTSTSGAAVSRAFGLATRAGTIRLDATTRALIGDAFVLRGTEGGTALDSEKHETGATSTSGQIVGRARELASLRAALDAVRDDAQARAVLLVGPVGQGKSTLVAEFLRSAQASRVARVRCDSTRSDAAFCAATELALRLLLPAILPSDMTSRREALRDALRRLGRPAPLLFLEHLLGLDGASPSPEVASAARDPRLLAEKTTEEWVHALSAALSEGPIVLVIESLEACDVASLRLLDRALGELDEQPLLVVATASPELDDIHPRALSTRLLDRIQIAPLAKRAAETLVRARLGAGAPAETVERIVEQAGGNPLFLLELSNASKEGLTSSPSSVLALLQERLERLEANARRVLRAASIFGETFWRGGVEHLVGQAEAATLSEWLEELVRRDVIVRSPETRLPGEQQLAFRHALLRDAANATLTDTDLVVGHRLAAEWLESHGESDSMVIARHFELGNQAARAVPHWEKAALAAFDRNDPSRVIELVSKIEAAVGPEVVSHDLTRAVILSLIWTANTSSVVGRIERALAAAPRGTEAWFELTSVLLRALALERSPRFRPDLEALLSALEAAPEVHPPLEDSVEIVMGCLRAGDRTLAERAANAFATRASTALDEGYLLRARAWLAMYDGALDSSLELDEAALGAFERAGHGVEVLAARNATAYGYAQLGRNEMARAQYEHALAIAQRRGLHWISLVALHNLGMIARHEGDLERAVELHHEASTLAKGVSQQLIAFMAQFHEALTLVDLERLAEAKAIVEPLVDVAPPGPRAVGQAALARALLKEGRADRALELIERAMREVDDGLVEEYTGEIRNTRTRALLASGRAEEARRAAEQARDALLARADRIVTAEARASFLRNVPENADTLRIAEELLGDDRTSSSAVP